AVLADGRVIAVGTIPELLATDHPWIQEYFNGPRGRAAKDTKDRLDAGRAAAPSPKAVDSKAPAGA
ncbi:MAG: ABC transporter ATP-binding protein, partial [Novosphingobium sp.]|nr:ABC transporter ATP-binding protein [Novosphingobium sp.]